MGCQAVMHRRVHRFAFLCTAVDRRLSGLNRRRWRVLGALPLPASGERVGVRGTLHGPSAARIPLARSLRSRPLPASGERWSPRHSRTCPARSATRHAARSCNHSGSGMNSLLVARHDVEAARLPVGLGLLDALLARGDEVPPDVARAVHGGAADEHDARVARRRHRDGVAGPQDQQLTGARSGRPRCRSRPTRCRARAPRCRRRSAARRRARASRRRRWCRESVGTGERSP